MPSTIEFNSIPKLPEDWCDKTDAESVWPTWGEYKSYLWGANAGNQFLSRGTPLNGGGLASPNGPSRGYAHPQYVGIDTMSDSTSSLVANKKVYVQMTSYLTNGHTMIIPIDLRRSATQPGKFSLGTGYGKNVEGATLIHLEMWSGIIDLISKADNVAYNSTMWTPDFSLPKGKRDGTRVDLPDYKAIIAYHAKLQAAVQLVQADIALT